MKNERYRLSPLFKILPKEEINNLKITDIQEVIKGKKFILLQIEKQQVYLINPAIHEFLQLFIQPVAKVDITKYYIQQYQTTKEEILPLLQTFFTEMLDQDIIVTEEEYLLIEEDAQRSDSAIEAQLQSVRDDFYLKKTLLSEYPLMMFLAERKSDKKLIVLKILIQNPRFSKKFLTQKANMMMQERELLYRFEGAHDILQMESALQHKQLVINAYEYIEGLPLFEFIAQNHLDIGNRWALIGRLISAFTKLHKAAVIHGDIHDGNVLVTKEGNVKIIDFDMAFSLKNTKKQHIRRGGMNGFIAPEKISYNFLEMVAAQPDLCSEVYQIGVLCYYCMYEKMPFEADTWKNLVEKVMFKAVKLPKTTKTGLVVPTAIIDFIGIALSKEKNIRYKTAEKMLKIYEFIDI